MYGEYLPARETQKPHTPGVRLAGMMLNCVEVKNNTAIEIMKHFKSIREETLHYMTSLG